MAGKLRKVAVVGGGVAGLATAYHLERLSGMSPSGVDVAVTLFEAESMPGGYLATRQEAGYQFEIGPNGFLDNEPATLRLVDYLGLRDQLQRSSDATRYRYLLIGGRLCELPMSPPAFVASKLMSFTAKLRMACELLLPRRSGLGQAATNPTTDETVYEFGKRRLGVEFAETMLDPMVKGIFGGDARRLSLAAAFPRMVELEREYRSLFMAMYKLSRARRKEGKGAVSAGPSGVLHGFKQGMAALPAALVASLKGEIKTDCAVNHISQSPGGGWTVTVGAGSYGPFDAIINAAPAHAVARQVPDGELATLLSGITYTPMVVMTLAYDAKNIDHSLNGFGMLIPSREQRHLLGVLWSSSIFSGRAPDGKRLLRCMAGGPGQEAILGHTDNELVELAVAELADLFGMSGQPEQQWVIRHPQAIAQYEPGHLYRLTAIDRILRDRLTGLYITGSSYRGISVNYCVKEAESAAAHAWEYLETSLPVSGSINDTETEPVSALGH
jgi:protoporphyrinogen/coproporphyrinogen III oxidase